jgi:hypothetical protein
MATKSLLEQLHQIVADGKREAEQILERIGKQDSISKGYPITMLWLR